MSDLIRKLLTFSLLLFTGFCFLKAGTGLISGDRAVSLTQVEATLPARAASQRLITTPIQKLQPGERLRSALGKTVRITSIEIRAGPEPVYNLEIAGEHVYSVTDAGLLVHNSGPCDETVELFSYTEKLEIKTSNFTTSTGLVYLTKYGPVEWLKEKGFKASLRRFTRIGKWKPLSNNYTYFTTGPIIPSEWGLKPIIPRTANFGKRLGRQFHTSLGTSGFKLKGYSNILVNEPIKSSNWKLIRGTGGFLWESSAHVLSLAGITAWGDLLIDGCQTEFKTFRQD